MSIDDLLADEAKDIDIIAAQYLRELDQHEKLKLMRLLKILIESYLARRQLH